MDIQELRQEFIHYLKMNYSYARPEVMAGNVFYAFYNDIGIPFHQIFVNEDSMKYARELLIVHFETKDKPRKNSKNDASVHYNNWGKFREFLVATDRLSQLKSL